MVNLDRIKPKKESDFYHFRGGVSAFYHFFIFSSSPQGYLLPPPLCGVTNMAWWSRHSALCGQHNAHAAQMASIATTLTAFNSLL